MHVHYSLVPPKTLTFWNAEQTILWVMIHDLDVVAGLFNEHADSEAELVKLAAEPATRHMWPSNPAVCDDLTADNMRAIKKVEALALERVEGAGREAAIKIGLPLSAVYDNTTIAVAKICGGGKRVRTTTFSELQSHYLFDDKFGRPGEGNDKGMVEEVVGFGRRNFLVPAPRFDSFDDLNVWLEQQCFKRQEDVVRGHGETIGERLLRDLDALMVLPPVPYDVNRL